MNHNNETKWQLVDRELRNDIVFGKLQAGDRFPTYEELQTRFDVSRITMQKVIPILKQDGFIYSKPRQGLFVSDKLPFLNRIALVLPRNTHVVKLWSEMILAAQNLATSRGIDLVVYRDVEESAESLQKLLFEASNHLLSGVIFTYSMSPARVAYPVCSVPGVPVISPKGTPFQFVFDSDRLCERTAKYFQQHGCRRVAIIGNCGAMEMYGCFAKHAESAGLSAPSGWQFPFAMECMDAAENCAALLMSLPEKQRPDGIFICDDNFTAPVIRGLDRMGIGLTDGPKIVAHNNWSSSSTPVTALQLIGFDLRELIDRIFDAFVAYRQDKKEPEDVQLHPLFTDELTPDYPAGRKSENDE